MSNKDHSLLHCYKCQSIQNGTDKIKFKLIASLQFIANKYYETLRYSENLNSSKKRLKNESLKRNSDFLRGILQNLHKNLPINKNNLKNPIFGTCAVTLFKNTTNFDSTAKVIEPIPEPPLPLPQEEEVLNQLNELGEATFSSIGLGGWTPVGIVQQAFEYFHVTLGIPWWEAIVIGIFVAFFIGNIIT